MKITFEGTYYEDILTQMANVLAVTARQGDAKSNKPAPEKLRPSATPKAPQVSQGPGPGSPFGLTPMDKPVSKPLDKPGRTEKQLANDERLRERAAAKKAAGLKPFDKMPKVAAPVAAEKPAEVPPADPVDPVEVVNIRNKTITDLQEAYANGHQQEVFELLSRFGNGAKSFRELPPEAFLPISQAIAKGALT